MHIVVGLGNPGLQYAETRHSAGFMVVDALARRWSVGWASRGSGNTLSQIARRRGGEEVLLVKPQTFMNASGAAVDALGRDQGFVPQELLVVFDDFNIDFGRVRLRSSGGDGGHNGLASIIESVGTDEVPRLRLGIGPAPEDGEDVDYVLMKFAADQDVDALISRGCQAVESAVSVGIDTAMNRFNGCAPL